MILILQHLGTAIRSNQAIEYSTLMSLLEIEIGAQEMVEELNSISGNDKAPLTESPLSSLKAIFGASKYKLQFLRNRIASSADAINAAIVELARSKRSEKSDQLVENEDDQQKSTIATWLSPLNFISTQRRTYRIHEPGTGQWLLESEVFQSWLDEKNESLAIAGEPGSGKTVLTSIIVHFLQSTFDNKIAVVWIYLHWNSPNQTMENILGSILQQLILQRVRVSENVMHFYREHCDRKDRLDIDDLVKVLATEILTFYRSFIIIDALDEIESDIRIPLLQILQSFQINLLVTSRTYPAMERELQEFTTLHIEASSNDMERFVEAELSKDHGLARVLSNDAELRRMTIKRIEENSQGMHVF